ncbi:hypothetical protein MKW92_027205 [Papaver armeniacum]|nr:hypothetical protein MKW92_027205 [Papaver armeniacum]
MNIRRMEMRRREVMKTLIEEQKNRISSERYSARTLGKTFLPNKLEINCYLDFLLSQGNPLTETQLMMLIWGTIIEDQLYEEIQKVCGNSKYMEEHFNELTYLSLYVHEDTQLGGYDIPAGTEIAINIYGCNMDKNQWDSPEEWKPERFLDNKYDPMDLYKTMAFGGGKRVCAGSLITFDKVVFRSLEFEYPSTYINFLCLHVQRTPEWNIRPS